MQDDHFALIREGPGLVMKAVMDGRTADAQLLTRAVDDLTHWVRDGENGARPNGAFECLRSEYLRQFGALPTDEAPPTPSEPQASWTGSQEIQAPIPPPISPATHPRAVGSQAEQPKDIHSQRAAWEMVLAADPTNAAAAAALVALSRAERVAPFQRDLQELEALLGARSFKISEVEAARARADQLRRDPAAPADLRPGFEAMFGRLDELHERILNASAGAARSERAKAYEAAITKYRAALEAGFLEIADDGGEPGAIMHVPEAMARARKAYFADLKMRMTQLLREAEAVAEAGYPVFASGGGAAAQGPVGDTKKLHSTLYAPILTGGRKLLTQARTLVGRVRLAALERNLPLGAIGGGVVLLALVVLVGFLAGGGPSRPLVVAAAPTVRAETVISPTPAPPSPLPPTPAPPTLAPPTAVSPTALPPIPTPTPPPFSVEFPQPGANFAVFPYQILVRSPLLLSSGAVALPVYSLALSVARPLTTPVTVQLGQRATLFGQILILGSSEPARQEGNEWVLRWTRNRNDLDPLPDGVYTLSVSGLGSAVSVPFTLSRGAFITTTIDTSLSRSSSRQWFPDPGGVTRTTCCSGSSSSDTVFVFGRVRFVNANGSVIAAPSDFSASNDPNPLQSIWCLAQDRQAYGWTLCQFLRDTQKLASLPWLAPDLPAELYSTYGRPKP